MRARGDQRGVVLGRQQDMVLHFLQAHVRHPARVPLFGDAHEHPPSVVRREVHASAAARSRVPPARGDVHVGRAQELLCIVLVVEVVVGVVGVIVIGFNRR